MKQDRVTKRKPAGPPAVPMRGALVTPGWLLMGLTLLTFFVYFGTLRSGFVNYDDPDYVTANQRVLGGLTLANVRWAFTNGHASNWHPLTWLSHMVDTELFGARPAGHHLVSVVLHLLNSALLFLVLRRMTGAILRSWFVAALFALHPLHVESVAWISERKDVLSTFCMLATLWAWSRYTGVAGEARAPTRRPLWYGASLLCFALGLMSKPMVVTLPFVLLLLDYWPLARWRPRQPGLAALPQLITEKLPFLFLSAAASVVTFMVQDKGGSVSSALPLADRAANAVVSYARYLGKMTYPVDLAVLYPHPGQWPVWATASAAMLLAGISAVAVRQSVRAPWFIIGWLWFLGTLVPVIGVVQVGIQSMADRYTYVPLIGMFIVVVWAAHALASRSAVPFRFQFAAGLGAVAICAGLTIRQVGFWRDSETLFRQALRITEKNYLAHNNRGLELAAKGQVAEAIQEYRRSIEINPGYVEGLNNLGHALAGEGKHAVAIPFYEAALQQNPAHPDVNNNYGNALSELGRIDDAIQHYEITLRARPDHADAHNNLGIALAMKGRVSEAVPHFLISLRNKPNNANARSNLGNAYAVQQRWSEAIEQYEQALRLRPDDSQAHNNLANVLLQLDRLDDAISHYREALRLRPDNSEAARNLQIALQRQTKSPPR